MERIYKDIKLNQVNDFSCEGCCLKRNIEDNGKLVANGTHICGLSKSIRWQGWMEADYQDIMTTIWCVCLNHIFL
jgi:hypothetical protein